MLSQIRRQRKTITSTSLLIVCCTLFGCSKQPVGESATATPPKSSQPAQNINQNTNHNTGQSTHQSAPTALPLLAPVDFTSWKTIQLAAKPDVVVVDLWATWCVPCLERFPHMVELSEQYEQQGVTFFSLSLDDRDDSDALTFGRDFLSKQDASFAHYLLDEELLDGFEKLDLQTVPAVDIYNRDGSLFKRFTGDNPNEPFDEADIASALKQLLAAG